MRKILSLMLAMAAVAFMGGCAAFQSPVPVPAGQTWQDLATQQLAETDFLETAAVLAASLDPRIPASAIQTLDAAYQTNHNAVQAAIDSGTQLSYQGQLLLLKQQLVAVKALKVPPTTKP